MGRSLSGIRREMQCVHRDGARHSGPFPEGAEKLNYRSPLPYIDFIIEKSDLA